MTAELEKSIERKLENLRKEIDSSNNLNDEAVEDEVEWLVETFAEELGDFIASVDSEGSLYDYIAYNGGQFPTVIEYYLMLTGSDVNDLRNAANVVEDAESSLMSLEGMLR